MTRTITITYTDDRFEGIVEESDCIDLTRLFISEGVLDLREPHIRDLKVATSPAT